MRRVLLAVSLWIGASPAVVQSVHALLHERRVAHVHEHDGDADHDDQDASHENLAPSLAPTLLSASPRLKSLTRVDFALIAPSLSPVEKPRAAVLDLGPPDAPPGRLVSAVPSNRAPPA